MSLAVKKTYKLFVGGKFPRSESGRVYQPTGNQQVNVARASRKDLRDAVLAARKGLAPWSGSDAYLRGQILYRLAEMLESRRDAVAQELRVGGVTAAAAQREVDTAIDLVVWYAGIADKLQSLLGSQNAVQGPFFNFSTVEPTGVVGVVTTDRPALVGALALALPALVSGNAVVALVCASSDVPAGALNLLSGRREELVHEFAAHRDIDALLVAGAPDAQVTAAAADNLKRVRFCDLSAARWGRAEQLRNLSWVEPFVETKTLWHPVAP